MIRPFLRASTLTVFIIAITVVRPVFTRADDDTDAALQRIATYEFGQSRESLSEVAELVLSSLDDVDQRSELARRLAELLDHESTLECKQFVCRQLALIGGPEQVPTLAMMMADEKLADIARLALDAIPGDEVAAALRLQLGTASGLMRIGIIQSLGQRRDENSVQALAVLVQDPHTATAQAAALALGKIGGAEAMDCLAVFSEETNGALQQLVWEGYLRGADRLAADGQVEPALAVYEQALAVAGSASHRAMALTAWDRITQSSALNEEQAGFEPLFNERDFTGWYGDTVDGWRVEEGVMICEGNSIWSEAEFGDFILRFDFRLTPNANNGLGIRLPRAGFAAYDCMELQINDDSGDEWQHLEDYQRHGAVYGVAPPKTGHLKPVGEWNTQEVIAHGRQITIKLNGVTILDVDLDDAARLGMLNGLNHLHFPGFYRESGCLNFQGHGSRSEFRNVRIRKLATPRPPKPEYAGFKDLFNGNDLTGLQERFTNGVVVEETTWHVHDRSLVSGAHMLYVMPQQFDDFILRFHFKLSTGSDSGLLLRTATPPGVPGMEIQIRDDSASGDGEANQCHGSIVGIAPAVGGYLRPVGQWNVQEVVARDGQITVNLNGETILETDVWQLAKELDDQQRSKHAGLTRSTGYIAFLGYGDDEEHPTEFCNIRIKEL